MESVEGDTRSTSGPVDADGATFEWLRNRYEVRQLFIRYCDALDHLRWELLDDVFAPDVVTTWALGTTSRGRAETVDYITRHWVGLGRTHHHREVDVTFDGDVAGSGCGPKPRSTDEGLGCGVWVVRAGLA